MVGDRSGTIATAPDVILQSSCLRAGKIGEQKAKSCLECQSNLIDFFLSEEYWSGTNPLARHAYFPISIKSLAIRGRANLNVWH